MKTHFIFLILISLSTSVAGQSDLLKTIRETTVPSKILNQERKILLFTSGRERGYPNHYPTIYLLDGKENFLLTAGIISNLVRAECIPPVNLVGINTYDYDREFDLSTKSNSAEVYFETGGALNFQAFILEELFPYVTSKLSTSQYKLLIGHSLGGRFALDILLDHPDSFSAAILADPSLWWNDGEVLKKIKNSDFPLEKGSLYLSRSGLDQTNLELFNELEQLLNFNESTFARFPDENHISVLAPTIFNGLKHIFKAFSTLDRHYQEAANFPTIKASIDALNIQYHTTIIPKVRVIAPMARNHTKAGHFSDAIAILKYLEGFHPEDIMVLNFLGEAYQKSDDLELAKLTYQKSWDIANSKKSPMVRWIEQRLKEVDP